MILTRGRNKDREAVLHQAANDWLSVDLDGKALILNPTSARFTDDELVWLDAHAGDVFWNEYAVTLSGSPSHPHRLVKR